MGMRSRKAVVVTFLFWLGGMGAAPSAVQQGGIHQQLGLKPWPFEHVLGEANLSRRPCVLVVYGSLSCSHCADFHLKTLRPLLQKYPGKLTVVVRDRPLDLYALQACLLSYCDPQRTAERQKVLLEKQTVWMPSSRIRKKMTSKQAHAWVTQKIAGLLKLMGGMPPSCQQPSSFQAFEKMTQLLSKHEAFQKMTTLPVVILFAPEKNGAGYTAPRQIPLNRLDKLSFEREIEGQKGG